MSARIEYFFTLVSPYAYLGHAALMALAVRHGATVVPRPVKMVEVFRAAGGVPLGQRAAARQRYRFIELQRARAERALPLNLQPKFFPVDGSLADRCACALIAQGHDVSEFMLSAFRTLWVEEGNLADVATLSALLARHGFDAGATLAQADAEAAQALYEQNTQAAIAFDLPGLPGYVLQGEPFWGQDRLDALDAALRSGRTPYRAL
ncbi:2-hydroxychromene-2-carboxylate isomerase [Pseudoxanthomonas composti]|uniref:2-hydroxychromene-2-carboxylate isomerase n=1 Tax=Pseudoxanthomonas composti TaxID=2137479 RepID=A0A4Q1K010_9GAMM|nr:2-hydroxychromene-2-carboxylate isomerase [Pseudoxanthomonas composti]RXR08709.1 2-hydroxychromene-2-carboxylate isomerase [Pseudoxanthomonas composti]